MRSFCIHCGYEQWQHISEETSTGIEGNACPQNVCSCCNHNKKYHHQLGGLHYCELCNDLSDYGKNKVSWKHVFAPSQAKRDPKFPHSCRECNWPAYEGAYAIECSNRSCMHFSYNEEEPIRDLRK